MRYFQYLRKSTDDKDHQVLSLESQERENARRYSDNPDIEIVETITEKRSAKVPGRPLFNAMLDRIERGEAEGIIAWLPDRLARNSIDGGRLIYLLDTGKLKDLKFASYSFQNTPHGKYMLQIDFANAKLHVDSLSVNVRIGNRTKIENGWWPRMAPTGYLNVDRKGPTPIVPDPERFPLVKRLFEYALSGAYTVPQLLDIASNEWGLRTFKRRKIGGKPFTLSGLYNLLGNPFYAGILRLDGKDYPGKHPAMLTIADFQRLQKMLGRGDAPRAHRHEWDYTGLMKCVCGRSITAEHKTNRFGSRYAYYHCTRRQGAGRCSEPYIELRDLESEFRDFIASVTLSPKRHEWAIREALRSAESVQETLNAQRTALEKTSRETAAALKNLRHLRTHDQITEAEFLEDRDELLRDQSRVDQELERLSPANVIEPERAFVLLNVRALQWFDQGDGATRRLLLEATGSNPTLTGGKLSIDAAFPFVRYGRKREIQQMCTRVHDVRTHATEESVCRLVSIARLLTAKFGHDPFTEAA